jgi:hypothetical protein
MTRIILFIHASFQCPSSLPRPAGDDESDSKNKQKINNFPPNGTQQTLKVYTSEDDEDVVEGEF